MSSTLYGRGTLLQTGGRERAIRVDQQITELRTVLHQLLEERKMTSPESVGQTISDMRNVLRQVQEELKVARAENVELTRQIKHIHAVTGIPVSPHTTT
jgi:hypothetical protein